MKKLKINVSYTTTGNGLRGRELVPTRLHNHREAIRFYLQSRLLTNLFPDHEIIMGLVS